MPVAWHCIKPNSAPLPAWCWTWGLGQPPLSLIVPWASPLGRQGFWEQKKLIWGSKKEGLLYCFCISKPGGFIFPLTAAPCHHPLCLCSEVWFGYWASTGVRSLAGTGGSLGSQELISAVVSTWEQGAVSGCWDSSLWTPAASGLCRKKTYD